MTKTSMAKLRIHQLGNVILELHRITLIGFSMFYFFHVLQLDFGPPFFVDISNAPFQDKIMQDFARLDVEKKGRMVSSKSSSDRTNRLFSFFFHLCLKHNFTIYLTYIIYIHFCYSRPFL